MKTFKILLLIIAVVIAYKAKSAILGGQLLSSFEMELKDGDYTFNIIKIDKCEYIMSKKQYSSVFTMIHKQDCSYCKTLKSK